jgi:SPASM domain peptide maturase of grasp-with-spasm system
MIFKLFYKFHSNCVPVRGEKFTIIYDLLRESYIKIPNEIANLIINNQGNRLETIFSDYDNQSKYIIKKEILLFLRNQQLLITTKKKCLNVFPKLKFLYDSPNLLTNGVVFTDNLSVRLFSKLELLFDFQCYNFQIWINQKVGIKEIQRLIHFINESPILYTEICIKSVESIDLRSLSNITNKRIVIFLLNNLKPIKNNINKGSISFIYKPAFYNFLRPTNTINPSNFLVNYELFTESQKFNNFLNKKIFVLSNNDIKLHPNDKYDYGKLSKKNVLSFLNNKRTTLYWSTSKSKLNKCKSCEYRFMCVDPGLPFKKGERWHAEAECNYDPKLGRWT